jgi:competence protein ComEA
MRAWRGYVVVSLVWLSILAGALWIARRPPPDAIEIVPPPAAPPTAPPTRPLPPSPTPAPLHVDVAGAVAAPGVYRLPPGSIVADAIAVAGGPASDADLDRLNKAVELQDGVQVVVPRRGEAGATPVTRADSALAAPALAEPGAAASDLIDLNTATLEELDSLPGIGPALAQRIVDDRPYGAVEELLRVKGIGPTAYDKMKSLITVH